jgi:hypothetical protein
MKTRCSAILVGLIILTPTLQGAASGLLHEIQIIPLPNVEGRIDHFGVDIKGQRLFVPALGNNTVEVLGPREGKRLTSITDVKEPQGVFYVPPSNRLFVANGDDGTCRVFDGSSYKLLVTVSFPSDADNVRYDAARNHIYVGYGEGALGVLNSTTGPEACRNRPTRVSGIVPLGRVGTQDLRKPAECQSHDRGCRPRKTLRDRNVAT